MRVARRSGRTLAVAAVLALTVAACGGGDDEPSASGSDEEAASGGEITVGGCNPENPLIPSNTNETCGGNVLDQVFSKLFRYDPETAESKLEIAEAIETTDNQTFTITIQDGWTFHDGTPITAESFKKTWDWAADGRNAQLNAYFFEPIEGYAELQAPTDAEGNPTGDPTGTELTGVTAVDESTLEVTLTAPASAFPDRLGYTAFAPLPDVFFDDTEAFGDLPIGSGPFMVESYDKEQQIVLQAYPEYNGATKPSVETVTFKIYQNEDAQYADLLANNVDVVDQVSSASLADNQYQTDLGEGRWLEQETGVIQTITFAAGDPLYANPDVRKAISMAIDRESIIENILPGRTPAQGFVSPVVDGFAEGACGEFCTYDPEAAKALLDSAGGIAGTITLSYNADADHKGWTEAACQSISNALAVECQATPVVDFATFRASVNAREIKGLFRTGWQMDYPSIENFLVPIYATGASSNDGDYSSPEFDALLEQAATAEGDEAITLYQEAEQILVQDFPSIPLWYGAQQAGWSDRVDNVRFSPFSTPDLLSITLK